MHAARLTAWMLALVLTSTAWGQHAPPERTQPARFDLSFPGGTIAEYVEAIRAAHPSANVVVHAAAADLPAPPAELTGVTLEAAMYVINARGKRPGVGDFRVEIDGTRIEGTPEGLFTVRYWSENPPEAPVRTRVWSVAEVMRSGTSSKDILTAVETAADMFPGKADIKFHEATGLLIARGEYEQVDLIHETLEALWRGGSPTTGGAESRIEELELEAAALRDQLAVQTEQGGALQERIRSYETELVQMQRQMAARVTELEIRLEDAMSKAAEKPAR